jgi:hypothetical protein
MGTGPFWRTRFVLKSPQKAYRIYKTKRVTSDGEIFGCFQQKKSELRWEIASPCSKNLYLDELAVGGGDGTDMLRRIKKAALRVGPSGH